MTIKGSFSDKNHVSRSDFKQSSPRLREDVGADWSDIYCHKSSAWLQTNRRAEEGAWWRCCSASCEVSGSARTCWRGGVGAALWTLSVPLTEAEAPLFPLSGIDQQKVLFLAQPRLIVQPSIYKYVNMSGTRHNTTRLYTPRRSGEEVSAPPPPPPTSNPSHPPKIVFLDGFNEYRMFIVTIPCDSHKRLEKSTSTTLPPPSHTPYPPIPQSTTKEEEGVRRGEQKIKSKFVVKRSRIVVLSVCFPLRSLLDKHSMALRCICFSSAAWHPTRAISITRDFRIKVSSYSNTMASSRHITALLFSF